MQNSAIRKRRLNLWLVEQPARSFGQRPRLRARLSIWAGALATAAMLSGCVNAPGHIGDRRGGDQPPTIVEQSAAARGGETRSLRRTTAPQPGQGVAVDPSGRVSIALLAPLGSADPGVRAAGDSIVQAARMALDDIGDPALQLDVFDTAGDPSTAAAAARSAVSSGASIILGPLFGQSTRAAAPVARQAGLTMLSFSTDPSVAGGNVFLLGQLVAQEVERIMAYAAARGVREVAAMAPQSAYGNVALEAARRSASRWGGAIVDEQRYQRSFEGVEEAVRGYVDRAKLSSGLSAPALGQGAGASEPETPERGYGPPGMLLVDEGQMLQTLAAFLVYFDVSPRGTKFLGVGRWNTESTRKETSLRGGWFAAPEPEVQALFAERFANRYGAAPHSLAGLGYDAVAASAAMVAEARAVGSPYPFTPRAITDPSGFAGVNGVFRFRSDGLNERGLAVLEVRPDQFAVIDPAPKSFSGF